jgi:glutaredoxin-like protein
MEVPLIQEKDREFIKKEFEVLKTPVRLVVFYADSGCDYCNETRQISEELSELSDKVSVSVHNFDAERELADKFGIDKVPATIVMSEEKDYGIRYFGIPSGHEFMSVLEDIIMVGTGEVDLQQSTLDVLKSIKQPVHMKVFITPTCPYCPRAVRMAHKFAYVSDFIRGDMIEALEFPALANQYNVMAVPRTVINDRAYLEGAAPENMFIDKILEALSIAEPVKNWK